MGFLLFSSILHLSVRFCSTRASPIVMRYLNVAEKNDAAKNIAAILSRGASQRVGKHQMESYLIKTYFSVKVFPLTIKFMNLIQLLWDNKLTW